MFVGDLPSSRSAASCTDRDISLVVAVCSSTAEAMVVCRSEICATIVQISSIAATAAVVSPWIASTRRAMSSVAFAVSCASSLTSLATTAKPLPASPARAASIVAFSASRFVCSAMLVITLTTLPISAEDSPSLATVAVVVSAAVTARAATSLASAAFEAISRIEAPICSAPAATVCTLRETSSAAADDDTRLGARSPRADAEICAEDADSSSERRGDGVRRGRPRWRAPRAGSPAPRPATRPSGRPRRAGVIPLASVRSPSASFASESRIRPERPGDHAGHVAGRRRRRRPGRRRAAR